MPEETLQDASKRYERNGNSKDGFLRFLVLLGGVDAAAVALNILTQYLDRLIHNGEQTVYIPFTELFLIASFVFESSVLLASAFVIFMRDQDYVKAKTLLSSVK